MSRSPALAFAAMPIAAQAQAPIAASVYTAQYFAGSALSPPDPNGDRFFFAKDIGPISGGFNGRMNWVLNYVWHTRTGIVDGTGAGICDPCTVNGLIGTVNFTLTASGHGSLVSCPPSPSPCPLITIVGGTWTISSATGALVGLTGSGTWTQTVLSNVLNRFLSGSARPAGCDSSGNLSGNQQCKQ